ncbi:hypothetical protein [Saccharothrix sp. ALI-22-I]|nr:hypothetical protein [Saccharothrix sp. ALI-22-I]
MLTDLLLAGLIELILTVLVLAALVITCGAMYPPRPPRGPRH